MKDINANVTGKRLLERTVFAHVRAKDVRTEPFPHLVVENALDADLFTKLLSSRPPYCGGTDADNLRTPTPAWVFIKTELFDPIWTDFVTAHTRPDITHAVRALFKGHLAETQPDLPDDSRFGVDGLADWRTADVLCDARLEIISPALTAGSHRKAHLDTPNRLFTALLYLRAPDDTSVGGGLNLFRWKNGPKGRLDAFELDENDVECVTTVPYRENTLVVFPNSVNALHGCEVRQPTDHDRAYVFITAEMQHDLF